MNSFEDGARAAYEGKGERECGVFGAARDEWLRGHRAAKKRIILDRLAKEFNTEDK